jgi:hypothetical protein
MVIKKAGSAEKFSHFGGVAFMVIGITNQPTIESWTARPKADLVLEMKKGRKSMVDAAREYDLQQSEIQKWTAL